MWAGGMRYLLMFPYLAGFELAPTTAKAGKEKKVLAAASVPTMIATEVGTMRNY